MMSLQGGLHRALQAVLFQTALYGLLFLCTVTVLGIYSYFVIILLDYSIHVAAWKKAVETIACAATIYLVFACLATLCLGGRTIVAIVQIVLDFAFSICMIAISVITRDGAASCKGTVTTPLGIGSASNRPQFERSGPDGESGQKSAVNLGQACRLNTIAFVLSTIAAVLFLCTAAMQMVLKRYHEAERPSGTASIRSDSSDLSARKSEQRWRTRWHIQDSITQKPKVAPREWFV